MSAFNPRGYHSDISLRTLHQDALSYNRCSEESIYSKRSATPEIWVVSPRSSTVGAHGDSARIGRTYDFRIGLIGATNRPGPFLDVPKPAQSPKIDSPPRATNALVPCTSPTVIDNPHCNDRWNTSMSLRPCRRRLAVAIPQSIKEADESTVAEENADVSPYVFPLTYERKVRERCPKARLDTVIEEKEREQGQGSTRNDDDDVTDVMFPVLQAPSEESTGRLTPTFVNESDDDSSDGCLSPSPASSPTPSSLFEEIPDSLSTPGTTPPSSFAEKSRLSASYISPEDSCEEEIDIAPFSMIHASAKPLVQTHRRTNAVHIRCPKELDRERYLEGPCEVSRTPDLPRSADTKWTAVDGMIVVKVFVPATDDIWRVRVPQDISLQRFTSKVLSKLGFHVAFSGSCFDGPEYHFRTNDAFRRWIDNRVRNGRNLPIVAHVIDAPPLPLHVSTSLFSSVRSSSCIADGNVSPAVRNFVRPLPSATSITRHMTV